MNYEFRDCSSIDRLKQDETSLCRQVPEHRMAKQRWDATRCPFYEAKRHPTLVYPAGHGIAINSPSLYPFTFPYRSLKFSKEASLVMQSDGFEYLKEKFPRLQSELLKTVAGCEEDYSSSGGKSRSVCEQLSDGGDTTGRRLRQRTWIVEEH
ncbi:BTB/POZ-like protein [Artemisia annua]|uniref:BTB/POZ-like protein n=1 Tax=Artemisia annua TaxID=35608 RepID=A0A2U1KLC5_ARTAN|nr:BTB/POZ-like protein [Artemisia annua]